MHYQKIVLFLVQSLLGCEQSQRWNWHHLVYVNGFDCDIVGWLNINIPDYDTLFYTCG